MEKKILTRRQFMTTVAAGAGTVLLGKTVFGFPSEGQVKSTNPFRIVSLGRSGIKTTLLGMGTGFNGYKRSSSITRAGKEVAVSMIRYAYDSGIRYFDCADLYGTHPFMKEALKSFPRESYTIGTKIWVETGGIPEPERPDADIVIDRFRKELDTDYIDLVQMHCMKSLNWTDQHKRQMDILDTLKAKKIIRAHGVSIHTLEAMEAAATCSWVDVAHVRVNPYGEAMDHSDPAKVIPVIEKLHKAGKGVIGMKLIGNGKFKNDSEKIDASLKYVLGLGTVNMIIVGFELPEQIDNYVGRVKMLSLN
jgi:aryl-alcohol dehydrogenase-like predicted oxidoreductase